MATTAESPQLATTNLSSYYHLFYFCGLPGFCQSGSRVTCSDVPISQCSSCNIPGVAFFLIIVFLLFFAIVIGNSLIQACFVSSANMRTKMDYVRLSLSVSDMLTGFQIVAVMIPNTIRTFSFTQTQLDLYAISSTDTPKAVLCGWLFNLSFTSSMYHMVALCVCRLMAVVRPIKYQTMSNKYVFIFIACAWALAVYTAFVPLFPGTAVAYTYFESAFVFLPTRRYASSHNGTPFTVLVLSLVFPYICVTVLLIATATILKMKRRKSDAALNRNQNNSSSYKQEIRIIITLTIMFLSHTSAVVPLVVCVVLINLGKLSCGTMGLPSMLTVLLATSNSLVNVIVYGTRDARFRKAFTSLIRKFSSLCGEKQNPPKASQTTGKSHAETTRRNDLN